MARTFAPWPRRTGAGSRARRDTLLVLVASRGLVWIVAILSAVVLGAKDQANALYNDVPQLTRPGPSVGRVLLSPLAHWDSVWYLGIVEHGYGSLGGAYANARTAFFPLYPLLVWLASGLAATPALQLIAAFAVSLVAFTMALFLLHRLVTLELGEEYARPTLLLVALFPGALFFGIPYSESLFLLVSVAAFYVARTGHWRSAGILAGAASAVRSAGLLLVVPLVLMYLYGPRDHPPPDQAPHRAGAGTRGRRSGLRPVYPLKADLAWLLLAPAGLAAYSAFLAIRNGDGFAWVHVQSLWSRHFDGPFGALVAGASAAWNGVHGLLTGSATRTYLQHGPLPPARAAVFDIGLFAFAIATVVTTIAALRRLPIAYGMWALVSLLLPLSYPADGQPLESLPRFVAVLFPLFMMLALWCRRGRKLDTLLAVFATLLALFTALFAGWQFVS